MSTQEKLEKFQPIRSIVRFDQLKDYLPCLEEIHGGKLTDDQIKKMTRYLKVYLQNEVDLMISENIRDDIFDAAICTALNNVR